ncbi:Putative pyridoxal phosphate-dependent acyltransferase [Legionella massiliensis]|uniref:8-amino-7-oxononanoate synthase n=1 Tax=Legionella massiliensis TaxID=1034943 RepID=A0A078KZB5_9GAMM|nr:aminotransferase class I/II-fold pyridoxal phosphate-dependent enzyme [Legionella massiliensis]CDZ77119.1 Putative pyridoxal phosphate-dependent acyltransferase [Legionella massiliensis]CEE12857.1 Putative pyridoxal phosphate-dependent acyltransferase [Legionella massiliensis]
MDNTELHLLVTDIVAKELLVNARDINPTTHLVHYGLNSIHAITLAGELTRKLQINIDFSTLINLRNIKEIVVFIDETLNKKSLPGLAINSQYEIEPLVPPVEEQIALLADLNLYFCESDGLPASVIQIEGQSQLNFSSYNYLGFAHDNDIINASIKALKTYGTSASASRVAGGQKTIHRELEQAIARFLNVESALIFNSGHATNVTTIGHLMQADDLILLDELSHNSLIQGAQLSGAQLKFFNHNNVDSLRNLLSDFCHQFNKTLVVTEGIFSMDGDIAPLDKYVALKNEFPFFLYVDEAHSLGVLGQKGAGIGEHYSINRSDVDLWMGTLSKAMASCGGYIAGNHQLINYLKYTSPGSVFSCGLSPADTAAALASFEKLQQNPDRVQQLRDLSNYLIQQLNEQAIEVKSNLGSPIIPIIIGDEEMTIHICKELRKKNIYLQAIIPPVIAANQSRLRVFINHAHTYKDIDFLVKALASILVLA